MPATTPASSTLLTARFAPPLVTAARLGEYPPIRGRSRAADDRETAEAWSASSRQPTWRGPWPPGREQNKATPDDPALRTDGPMNAGRKSWPVRDLIVWAGRVDVNSVAGVPITVFLLDDHEIVRRGIAQLLESEDGIEVIGQAGTAAEALARIPALRPDVAILDVRLPDGDGVSVCREVRGSVEPPPTCLMLTSYSDDEALFSAIMAGASGYLLKQVAGIDLVGAVRTVAAGGSLLDPRATALVLERLRKGDEPGDPRYASLSPQEQRILGLIADGLTNRQIGAELFLAEKTVKNYVSSLLHKLGFARRTEAAVYATEHKRTGRDR